MTKKKTVAKPYEPTPSERERVAAYFTENKEDPLPPRVKVSTKAGVAHVEFDNPEPAMGSMLLMDALGTRNTDFLFLADCCLHGWAGPRRRSTMTPP